MNLIKAASDNFEWGVDLGECARIWKGGCIIRAAFLDDIKSAYVKNPNLDNLLVDPYFAGEVFKRQASWRRVVSLCVSSGIAAPAMTASLSYFDSYRRARLPANLVQVRHLPCQAASERSVPPSVVQLALGTLHYYVKKTPRRPYLLSDPILSSPKGPQNFRLHLETHATFSLLDIRLDRRICRFLYIKVCPHTEIVRPSTLKIIALGRAVFLSHTARVEFV